MNTSFKKVLITGADGFLGSHICEAAHASGYQVHGLIHPVLGTREWLEKNWITVHVSALEDRLKLRAALEGIYAVVHAAGALPGSSAGTLQRVNVDATRIVAEEAVKAGVKKFIFISSRSAGGVNQRTPYTSEEEPDGPSWGYGASKKAAELVLSDFTSGMHIVSLRPVTVYGPRNRHLLRLFKLIDGPLALIMGMRPIHMPMVYVSDLAQAVIRALASNVKSGSYYYISDGIPYTIETLYDYISAALRRRSPRLRVPLSIASAVAGIANTFNIGAGFSPDVIKERRSRYRWVSVEKARE
ncbi:NAD-dependent epimerase/dehydratase family protein, partial [candidate division WOR-3 bacterium]|nr:NAD-dependent epimerase/dehydratase family protein [candidate division WOR-3 bacterium]